MTLPLGSTELQELDLQVKAAVAANSEEEVVAAADPPLRQQEHIADWELAQPSSEQCSLLASDSSNHYLQSIAASD